jgi:hypothetical protein
MWDRKTTTLIHELGWLSAKRVREKHAIPGSIIGKKRK